MDSYILRGSFLIPFSSQSLGKYEGPAGVPGVTLPKDNAQTNPTKWMAHPSFPMRYKPINIVLSPSPLNEGLTVNDPDRDIKQLMHVTPLQVGLLGFLCTTNKQNFPTSLASLSYSLGFPVLLLL